MIFDRLFNTLQYRLRCEEKNWQKENRVRRGLRLSKVQNFFIILGRNPMKWVSWALVILVGLSLFTALVDSTYWTIFIIDKFHVDDPGGYLTSLWAVQATISGMVYPIVISFVALLIQVSNNSKADLHIFLDYSAALPAVLIAMCLVLAMGLQFVGLPYVHYEVVFFWSAIDSIWFFVSTAFTINFLIQTLYFIQPRKRETIVKKHLVNVAWPGEVRAHRASEILVGSCAGGLLPGPRYGEDLGAKASILTFRGFEKGEPEVVIELKENAQLKNIRFGLLKIIISLWKKRAQKGDGECVFEIPVTPYENYDGKVTLCSIRGTTKLGKISNFIVRHSFVFGPADPNRAVSLSVSDVLKSLQNNANLAIGTGDFDKYQKNLREFIETYNLFILVSEATGAECKSFNYIEISNRDRIFGGAIYLDWSSNLIKLNQQAMKRIAEDNLWLRPIMSTPNTLFNAALNKSTPGLSNHFISLSCQFFRSLEDWWSEKAESLGYQDHNFIKPVTLPAPHSRNHERAIELFVGRWEEFSKVLIMRKIDKHSTWSDLVERGPFLIHHLRETVVALFVCFSRGDVIGAYYIADVLIKWIQSVERLGGGSSYYMLDQQKQLSVDLLKSEWGIIEKNLTETSEYFTEKITPSAIFSSCIYNLWQDTISIVLFVFAEKVRSCDEDSCLPVDLFSALLTRKSLQPGDEPMGSAGTGFGMNNIFLSILRQNVFFQPGDGSYGNLLEGILERINDLERPNMITNRLYSGWADGGLKSLTDGLLLTMMVLVYNGWKPDGSTAALLSILAKSENEQIRRFQRIVESWQKRLNDEDFGLLKAAYERIGSKLDKSLSFDDARSALRNVVVGLLTLLKHEHEDAVNTNPIDPKRENEISRWASKEAFAPETARFPVNLFQKIESTHQSLENDSIRVKGLDRGEFTSPRCASPIANEEGWFADIVKDSLAVRVLGQVITELKSEKINADSAVLYWREIKKFLAEAKARKLTPLLILDNTAQPDWISEWEYSRYDSISADVPADLVVTQNNDINSEFYEFSLNDMPVYSAPIKAGESILLVTEALHKIDFRKYEDGTFVKTKVEEVEGFPGKVDVVLSWEMKVEVKPSPAVRLIYSDEKE